MAGVGRDHMLTEAGSDFVAISGPQSPEPENCQVGLRNNALRLKTDIREPLLTKARQSGAAARQHEAPREPRR